MDRGSAGATFKRTSYVSIRGQVAVTFEDYGFIVPQESVGFAAPAAIPTDSWGGLGWGETRRP